MANKLFFGKKKNWFQEIVQDIWDGHMLFQELQVIAGTMNSENKITTHYGTGKMHIVWCFKYYFNPALF